MNMKSYLIGISVTGAIAFMPFSVLADWKEGWTGDVRYKYVVSSDAGGTDTVTGDNNEFVAFNGDAVDGGDCHLRRPLSRHQCGNPRHRDAALVPV